MTTENFSSGASVKWDYHAGSSHKTRTGFVVSFVPAGVDAYRLAKKLKVAMNNDISFGPISTIDRYLIQSADGEKIKFFAPKATLVVSFGARKVPVARKPEVEAEPVKAEPIKVKPVKENTNATSPSVELAFGDKMPEAQKYTFVASSKNINAFARNAGYGIKFMFTGEGASDLTFVRKSSVRPAYTSSIIGVALNGPFGITKDNRILPSEKDQYVGMIAEALAKLGFTASNEHIAPLVSLYNDDQHPAREVVGVISVP